MSWGGGAQVTFPTPPAYMKNGVFHDLIHIVVHEVLCGACITVDSTASGLCYLGTRRR